MEDENIASVTGPYTFRGMDYMVTMWIDDGNNTLTVEVEDRLTADQWRGTFDAACEFQFEIWRTLEGALP